MRLLGLLMVCCSSLMALSRGQKCEDGVGNVIRLSDTSEKNGWIRFHDVKIATFDAHLNPHCAADAGAIHLPGFIRLISGTVEVLKPAKSAQFHKISLDLSAEQNSFFIGEICRNGKSQSSFVPDDICSWDFCALLGEESCKFLEQSGRMQIPDVYPHLIPLQPAAYGQVHGDWSLSAKLTQGGRELASLSLARKWHAITVGDASAERAFRQHIGRTATLPPPTTVTQKHKSDDEL